MKLQGRDLQEKNPRSRFLLFFLVFEKKKEKTDSKYLFSSNKLD